MDGLEWTASAMSAAQRSLDVAAQNLAGAPCDGFHRMLLDARMTAHGIETGVAPDTQAGTLRHTGRDLDIAVQGPGHMRLCNGSVRASASCERTLDEHLRTQDGQLVMGRNGALRFPLFAQIENDGSITSNGTLIDRLALTQSAHVSHGVVEASNGDSMHAMIDVLEAQRHFETAQKMTQTIDAVAAKDATEIGRPPQ